MTDQYFGGAALATICAMLLIWTVLSLVGWGDED